ncbi:DUF1697 domain-containing protein [Microbacterium sp. STN6]|uniref:DUF1697 domain-containing protein n=1 Tax=Microbacterium sp. STN6 TaxID=2995588 RepID=UPI002260A40F|nr:DUF1697 domain-containing protein [Microbacterium sp. STN6]MCX7523015.1 DUF1697 domain-containing protein [Microbacterium sp. STN6]
MARMIALLRGVNVGGITIKMADLADVFRGLGYAGVKTVLASGNVVFEADAAASALKPVIETALRDRFGYEAWVHVLSVEELAAVVAAYPFEEREGWHAYVIFVMGGEVAGDFVALAPGLDADERLQDGDGVLYWSVPKGNTLDSVVGKASGKARYKAQSTTRNLRTLRKLLG